MLSVAEARARVLALARVLGTEEVPLGAAAGRVLAEDVVSRRAQPPFPASAMDGYAVRAGELATGQSFDIIGEAAAGAGFPGFVGPGQAVRIFTGAPVPDGADTILIQEDADRDGGRITVRANHDAAGYVRPAGGDFAVGDRISAPRRLRPGDIALAAAMNRPTLTVRRRPIVALIPTGDELVPPGEDPGADQIVSSNNFGLAAMLEAAGALPRLLPIARDSVASLETVFRLAEGSDLVVTLGGASVGDHDLVQEAAEGRGLDLSFYKIAMRPGKPLMAGRMGDLPMLGLPGNPVSSMVCGRLFLRPMVAAFLGLDWEERVFTAPLAAAIPANGPREHYMRAARQPDGSVRVFERQDSSLLSVLQAADCLVVRAPHAPEAGAGDRVEVLDLDPD